MSKRYYIGPSVIEISLDATSVLLVNSNEPPTSDLEAVNYDLRDTKVVKEINWEKTGIQEEYSTPQAPF